MEEQDKPCIGLIFDASFLIWDVLIPMGIIYTILNRNRNAKFVYGGLPRLCMHVEDYAQSLNIPKDRLIKLEMDTCVKRHLLTQTKEAEWFSQLLAYHPGRIYCFRDNTHSNATGVMVMYAVRQNIPVIEIDNHGNKRQITKNAPSDLNIIYARKAGRIPYDV